MHEFSVSKEIASEVKRVAEEEDAVSVKKINLGIGRLSHLNPQQLEFCFESIADDEELLRDASIDIEEKDVEIECGCGYEGTVSDGIKKLSSLAKHLNCPDCGNLNPSIEKGRGIFIESIKIVRNEE